MLGRRKNYSHPLLITSSLVVGNVVFSGGSSFCCSLGSNMNDNIDNSSTSNMQISHDLTMSFAETCNQRNITKKQQHSRNTEKANTATRADTKQKQKQRPYEAERRTKETRKETPRRQK